MNERMGDEVSKGDQLIQIFEKANAEFIWKRAIFFW